MDIILDTNILIADIWQDSQNFRFLMNYLAKTNSSALVPSVVDVEVKAFFSRKIKDSLLEIQTAYKHAERFRISQLPVLDAEGISKATQNTWNTVYEKDFKEAYGRIIPLSKSAMDGAIERAAYRLPPCKENGDGIRDALIWLQIVEYCKTQSNNDEIAFISLNTHDFAGPSKITLRSELTKDIQGIINLLYFPSLESFLKEHSKSIPHITNEWLTERIELRQVKRKIAAYFALGWQGRWLRDKFKISKSDYSNYYRLDSNISIANVSDVHLKSFIVWEFNENNMELSLNFSAHIDGVAEGELIYSPDTTDFDKKDLRPRQALDCSAELVFHFAATLDDNTIKIGNIDNVS